MADGDDFVLSQFAKASFETIHAYALNGKLAVIPAKLHGARVAMICAVVNEDDDTDDEYTLLPLAQIYEAHEKFETLETADPAWIKDPAPPSPVGS